MIAKAEPGTGFCRRLVAGQNRSLAVSCRFSGQPSASPSSLADALAAKRRGDDDVLDAAVILHALLNEGLVDGRGPDHPAGKFATDKAARITLPYSASRSISATPSSAVVIGLAVVRDAILAAIELFEEIRRRRGPCLERADRIDMAGCLLAQTTFRQSREAVRLPSGRIHGAGDGISDPSP